MFAFAALANSNTNDLATYAFFSVFQDRILEANRRFVLKKSSGSTYNHITDTQTLGTFTYGSNCLAVYYDQVYVGGARKVTSGFVPFISNVKIADLTSPAAWYLGITATDGFIEKVALDKLWTTNQNSNHLLIGLGAARDSSYKMIASTKFVLIVG